MASIRRALTVAISALSFSATIVQGQQTSNPQPAGVLPAPFVQDILNGKSFQPGSVVLDPWYFTDDVATSLQFESIIDPYFSVNGAVEGGSPTSLGIEIEKLAPTLEWAIERKSTPDATQALDKSRKRLYHNGDPGKPTPLYSKFLDLQEAHDDAVQRERSASTQFDTEDARDERIAAKKALDDFESEHALVMDVLRVKNHDNLSPARHEAQFALKIQSRQADRGRAVSRLGVSSLNSLAESSWTKFSVAIADDEIAVLEVTTAGRERRTIPIQASRLSFDFVQLPVIRPWFDTKFFESSAWRPKKNRRQPVYRVVSELVLVRDVVLQAELAPDALTSLREAYESESEVAIRGLTIAGKSEALGTPNAGASVYLRPVRTRDGLTSSGVQVAAWIYAEISPVEAVDDFVWPHARPNP